MKSGINSTILIKDLIASQFIMKVKSSGVKINTNFNGDIISKKGSHYVYISNSN